MPLWLCTGFSYRASLQSGLGSAFCGTSSSDDGAKAQCRGQATLAHDARLICSADGGSFEGGSHDITPFSTALASRVDAGAQAPIPFLWGDFVMTIDEFSGLLGRVIAYAIGIPLVLASLLVAYWLVVTILRLVGVIELPDPIDWLPTEWTQHLPLPT